MAAIAQCYSPMHFGAEEINAMVVGTTILKMGTTPFYSPEFPRGGLAATFAGDATHVVGGTPPTMQVQAQHRNMDDTSFTNVGGAVSINATGTFDWTVTGLKEIVRFEYSFTAGSNLEGFHVVMGVPSWRPY